MQILLLFFVGLAYPFFLKKFFIKKGIFNPIYPLFLSFAILIIDYIYKLLVLLLWHFSGSEDIDILFIVCFYSIAFVIVVLYFLCLKLLPSILNRRLRKTSFRTNYSLCGTLVIIGSLIYAFSYCAFFAYIFELNVEILFILLFSSLFVIASFIFLSMELFHYERIKNEVNRTLSSLKTHRAPIIFLRSFELDKYLVLGRTFDEYVCRYFSLLAQPILSLCDPDSFVPTGGSIKIQSFDDKWKDSIITLFKNCRAVVIFEGNSDGLSWEISNLKKYISADKLFVVTPPYRYRMKTWFQSSTAMIPFHFLFSKKQVARTFQFLWGHFAEHLCREGITVPLKDPGSNKIFSFSEDWTCHSSTQNYSDKVLFDFILEKTMNYENATCDYSSIEKEIADYELSQSITKNENKKLKRASLLILLITVFLYLLCYIFYAAVA